MPRRAQLIRVLFCEIGRILSHLLNVTTQALDVGALTPPLWGFEEREKLMAFYERASGARLHANYFRPGGVHADLPKELVEDIGAWCEPFLKTVDDLQTRCSSTTASSSSATSTSGSCSIEDLLGLGLFRPVMVRGSGAPWDLRKSQPYEVLRGDGVRYPGRHATATTTTGRSCAWRRCGSRPPSCSNASKKLLAPEGQGPIKTMQGKVVPPQRAEMKRSMEALIHHFKLYTEGFHVPAGEVYAAVEAPKGEFGVYLVSDGTDKPYRCKIRAPGFAHLQAMDFMCRDHLLADVSAILGSLDIVFGEVDR